MKKSKEKIEIEKRYEEILEQVERVGNGDSFNDLESLSSTLRYLASEAELLKIRLKEITNNK